MLFITCLLLPQDNHTNQTTTKRARNNLFLTYENYTIMPRPISPEYYEEEEEDWCAFGGNHDFAEAIDESEDYSQDLSCGTDKSPIDVMGFPAVTTQSQRGSRRRPSSSKRIGQDVEVDGRRNRNRLPSKSRSLDADKKIAVAGIARQYRHLPRKSQSLGEDTKAAVAAVARQHRGRRSISMRKSQGEENPSPRNRRQSMTGGNRSASFQEEELDTSYSRQAARRAGKTTPGGNRRSTASRDATDRASSGERRLKSSSRQGSTIKEDDESAEERMKRIKELSNVFKAATILNKGIVPKTDHLKCDVLM